MPMQEIKWTDRLPFIRLGLQTGLSFGLTWVGVFIALKGDASIGWPYIVGVGLGYALLYSVGAAMSWKTASKMETSETREARILESLDLPPVDRAAAVEQARYAQQAWQSQIYASEQITAFSKWGVASWIFLSAMVGSALVWFPVQQVGWNGLVLSILAWMAVLVWVHRTRSVWRTVDFCIDLFIPLVASAASYGLMRWLT